MSRAKLADRNHEAERAPEFAKDVQQLLRRVNELKDDLTGLVQDAGEAAHSGVAAVRESAGEAVGAARERGERAGESFVELVNRRPLSSLGIAVGVGVIIGVTLGRRGS
jgi:ElaB/YqjD/DUF883 family membrane-anchored ribosome-binding protein